MTSDRLKLKAGLFAAVPILWLAAGFGRGADRPGALYAEINQGDQKAEVLDDREGALAKATASVLKAAERAAKDPTRPVFHLTSPANWINDPNAPIYYHGYYHLFSQHNPYGD